MSTLLHILGVEDMSSRWYAFWSGIGSDLGELGIIGAFLRSHNCHYPRCLRWGGRPVPGTPWLMCKRHAANQALSPTTEA